MSRALLILNSGADRQRAAGLVANAPSGTRVEFKAAQRTLEQNDKLWAMLTDVSRQVPWHGRKLKTDDWKTLFSAAVRKAEMVPGIDGETVVPLGLSTSDMSKQEFSDLLELIYSFGAEHGVEWSEPKEAA